MRTSKKYRFSSLGNYGNSTNLFTSQHTQKNGTLCIVTWREWRQLLQAQVAVSGDSGCPRPALPYLASRGSASRGSPRTLDACLACLKFWFWRVSLVILNLLSEPEMQYLNERFRCCWPRKFLAAGSEQPAQQGGRVNYLLFEEVGQGGSGSFLGA